MTDTSKDVVVMEVEGYGDGMDGKWVRASHYDALAAKLAEVTAERDKAKGLLKGNSKEWSDKPDDLTDAIKADFDSDSFYSRYEKAQDIVSNRHSKGSLVALVCYLLKAEAMLPRALPDNTEEGEG